MNVTFSADGTQVEYAQKKTYFFNRNESSGSEDDVVLVPNVPMIVRGPKQVAVRYPSPSLFLE